MKILAIYLGAAGDETKALVLDAPALSTAAAVAERHFATRGRGLTVTETGDAAVADVEVRREGGRLEVRWRERVGEWNPGQWQPWQAATTTRGSTTGGTP